MDNDLKYVITIDSDMDCGYFLKITPADKVQSLFEGVPAQFDISPQKKAVFQLKSIKSEGDVYLLMTYVEGGAELEYEVYLEGSTEQVRDIHETRYLEGYRVSFKA